MIEDVLSRLRAEFVEMPGLRPSSDVLNVPRPGSNGDDAGTQRVRAALPGVEDTCAPTSPRPSPTSIFSADDFHAESVGQQVAD